MQDTIPPSEQLALLLSLLGDDATDKALSGLKPVAADRVKTNLEEFQRQPPTQDEIEFVLDDFQKYFRFALESVGADSSGGVANDAKRKQKNVTALQIAEEGFDVDFEPVKKFMPPTLTGEIERDLNLAHPYQVAYALRNDTPMTISFVMQNLATEHAAKTLEFLPDAVRPAVFLNLAQPNEVSANVLDRVLKTTLERALLVEQRQPETDTTDEMVMLMRSLPKAVRVPMLAELMTTNEELGQTVKSQLYQFDDMSRLEARDVQKVLGQCDTESLVLALQGVEEELLDSILSNMSKRARETLVEEMEYKTDAKADEIEAGRSEIAKVIAELEESGAITLE